MMKIAKTGSYFVAGFVATMAVGCVAAGDGSHATPKLGISDFRFTDTDTKTTIIGVDAAGTEVARLELVHGRFTVGDRFAEGFPGQTEIVGRKLDVTTHGVLAMQFETKGYEPLMHMPAHPGGKDELAAFLADPHVKPVLDRWGLGFEPFVASTDSESAFTSHGGSINGTHVATYYNNAANFGSFTRSGTSYTISKCGGGSTLYGNAEKISATYLGNNEHRIVQFCAPNAFYPNWAWIGIKVCPTTQNSSSCGDATGGACVACSVYDVPTGEAYITLGGSSTSWLICDDSGC